MAKGKPVKYGSVGARGSVHGLQFNGKQEGDSALESPNLRCPRNGKQTSPGFKPAPLSSHKPLVALKQVTGKAMKVASASPDTGQQGGVPAKVHREAHALSGKAVRAFDLFFSHEAPV